jgi:uncharacterized membrane protein YbhN (UPF0104 family)
MLSGTTINRRGGQLLGLVGAAVALWAIAGVGMAYVAGFSAVHTTLERTVWWWLLVSLGGVLVAFAGYFFAYRGIKHAEGGPELELPSLLAVVTAGFGGFFAHGGTALDEYAMRAGGADKREATVRVSALAGFEHGVLAIICCPAAIVAWAIGVTVPRSDFTRPWAIIPPIGFALAIAAAERYRARLRDREGWRGKLGVFLDSIHLVWAILRHPRRYGLAVVGMLIYWGGDMLAMWAAVRAFGFSMSALEVIIALGTGMILTRRTAPLGGAGIMVVALTPTLWYGAAVPFATATMGVVCYRFFTLFVPMPAAFAALPKLRALGRHGEDASGSGTRTNKGEPALEH